MAKTYKEKRDFTLTPEPAWSVRPEEEKDKQLSFVVQRHESRRLHYDLRLELDGVLKSWAVPRGISMDPVEKRLAVIVEDHPLDYGSFEGIIPEGEYGAGKVTIWDKGTYSPEQGATLYFDDRTGAEKIIREGLTKGNLKIFFRGEKLKGSFALVRLKSGENNWLIIKHRDEYAPGQNEKQGSDDNRSHVSSADNGLDISKLRGAKKAEYPENLSPMLAFAVKEPISNPGWIYEPKLDGYRTLAFVHEGKVKLLSRNGIDTTARFNQIAVNKVLKESQDTVLDGEMVALDKNGHPCFQCLQDQLNKSTNTPSETHLVYYVFDILYLGGYDLTKVTLTDRKRILTEILSAEDNIRQIDYFEGDGELIYRTALSHGFEGIVEKKKDSIYIPGQRSRDWLKIKAITSGDFVIGGFELGAGERNSTFGALLLGEYQNGKLFYRGKVGTGFDETSLNELKTKLKNLKATSSPFSDYKATLMKLTWVRPELIAEVKYLERTREGRLRAPVFLRLREDKNPGEADVISNMPVNEVTVSQKDFDTVSSIIASLKQSTDELTLTLEGQKLKLTNLSKIYWPKTATHRDITKRDLLIYLTKVSSYILPHLHDRPVTLSRFPEGIKGENFFQRHWSLPKPKFVETVELPEERTGEKGNYILCQNLATLLWLAQEGNLEFHSWFSRALSDTTKGLNEENRAALPDFIIFDLDPYVFSGEEPRGAEPELNHTGFIAAALAAKWLKETLDPISLPAYIKTSGKTGLHIFIPIKRKFGYNAIRAVAESVASGLVKEHPDALTKEWPVSRRTGKVFIDYRQNMYAKTLASIYSPRATMDATVSMGLEWKQLDSIYPTDFNVLNAAEYLAEKGDPWADMRNHEVDLEKVLRL